MSYSVINLLAFLVGLLFITNGYRLVKYGREDLIWFLVSGTTGFGLIVVAVYPNVFTVVADLIGIKWKARAILVVSNITLFILMMFLFNIIKSLHDKISILNEEVSLLRNQVEESDE